MLSDFRFALRLVRRQPGFTAVAVLTLGLAVAANTSILSLLKGTLMRPAVPLRPEEYVRVYTARRDAGREFRPFSTVEFDALRAPNPVFSDVAAIGFAEIALGHDDQLRRSFAFLVSENFFRLGGVTAAAGRFFTVGECRPGARERVAVVSDAWWERMHRDPAVLGGTVKINGTAYTVVGVAPPGFGGVSPMIAPEIWLPLGVAGEIGEAFTRGHPDRDAEARTGHILNLVARLRPGLTLDSARPLLTPLAARLDAEEPGAVPRELVLGRPFGVAPTPQSRGPLALLGTLTLAMAALVLAIAGLNLANMLLARGAGRATEFAVRLAIGGSRGRVIRQLLAEALVIALLGGVVGCVLGTWGVALLHDLFASRVASLGFVVTAALKPDLGILLGTIGGCAFMTMLFGLGPALQSTRLDLVRDLKADGGLARGRVWDRFFSGPNLLATAQISLSVALLFVAGLFLHAAWQAGRPPPGLATRSTIVGELDFSLARTSRAEAMARTQRAVERLRSLPGVRTAGVTTLLPFANVEAAGHIAVADPLTARPSEHPPGAVLAGITPEFLSTIGVRLLRGRDFSETESRGVATARVCLLDEGMAARLFPRTEAVGQRIRLRAADEASEYEVVGVVAAHAQDAADVAHPLHRIYLPLAQAYSPEMFLALELDGAPAADSNLLGVARRELLALDPRLPLLSLRPFADHLADNFTLWQTRLGGAIFGLFGLLALALASIGVYGVKAYAVTRRTREIGIRMALGADRANVLALVLRQTVAQLVVALVVGAALSLACGQLLAGYLVNVARFDPAAFGFAAACLAGASVLATLGPALRATRVDPLRALRTE